MQRFYCAIVTSEELHVCIVPLSVERSTPQLHQSCQWWMDSCGNTPHLLQSDVEASDPKYASKTLLVLATSIYSDNVADICSLISSSHIAQVLFSYQHIT